MKILNIAALGALLLAAGSQTAHAQGSGRMGHGGFGQGGPGQGRMMGGGRGMNRPMPPAMMMKDADMKVENTPSGAIIRYTSSDPDTIKKIQENAALMKERHDALKGDKKDGKKNDAKTPDDKPADAKDGDKKDAKKEKPKDDKPKDKEAK